MTDPRPWLLGRRPALDGVRGLAILLVMAAHFGAPHVKAGGVTGVTLFFVLSGFLITSIIAEEKRDNGRVDVRAFYRRRALRLLPALFLLLAYTIFTAEMFPRLGIRVYGGGEVRQLIVATVFYVANWFRVAGNSLGGMHHTWSLAIEEQFYLIWPALLLLMARLFGIRSWKLAASAIVLALASVFDRFVLHPGHAAGVLNRIYFGTDTRADALLIGCALALWLVSGRSVRVPALAFVAGAACLAYVTLMPDSRALYTVGPTVAALGGIIVIAVVLDHARVASLLSWEPLRWTGRISYGLYLWHVPVSDELLPRLVSLPLALRIVIVASVSFAVAALSYYGVERYFLRMKRRSVRVREDSGAITRLPEVTGAV